ncbi:MAG: hypothetical protein SVY10_05395 [Thermodesulfobacteriota bacterium]|nr:hypothetical protein [Thermodesulfobacteriota bacterium]
MIAKLRCLIVCLCSLIIIIGCSTPVMKLNHPLKLDASYSQIGTIKVILFKDERLEEEKNEDMTAMNTLSPRLISGATYPIIIQYFHNTLREEIEKTKIFSITNTAQYVLSGEINSMKVERRVNVFRYFTFGLLDFPELTATVKYRAVLRKEGKIIFEKYIEQLERETYWAWSNFTFISWKKISNRGSCILDKCISNSIKKLFNEIESQIKTKI